VILFCSLPAVVALGSGFRLRRPLPLNSAEFTGLVRSAGWIISFLAVGQVLSLVVLPLTNAVAGHTLVWQTAWQIFLLPYALLAVPVLTARFPAMTSAARSGDVDGYAGYVGDGMRSVLTFGLLAGAAMIATGPLIARVVVFGEARQGVDDLGLAITGFGAGVAGYGVLMFLARAWFAAGDARTPALIQGAVVAGGSIAMLTLVGAVADSSRLLVLSLSFSAAQVAGAVLGFVMLWRVHLRDQPSAASLPLGIARRGVAAVAAGALMWIVRWFTPETRMASLAGLLGAAAVGVAGFLAVQRVLGGPGARVTLQTLGGSDELDSAAPRGLLDG
jgi:putative peptidoglycan lipid II flippase